MYSDPSQIRSRGVRINLNEQEEALINAYVAYTGAQKATLLRELLLEQAQLVLGGVSNYVSTGNTSEAQRMSNIR